MAAGSTTARPWSLKARPSYKHGAGASPEPFVAKIKALQQEGVRYSGCNFAFGGMEHRKVLRSMEQFAKKVMPHFSWAITHSRTNRRISIRNSWRFPASWRTSVRLCSWLTNRSSDILRRTSGVIQLAR